MRIRMHSPGVIHFIYLPKIELLCQLLLLHAGEEGVILTVQRQLVVQVPC